MDLTIGLEGTLPQNCLVNKLDRYAHFIQSPNYRYNKLLKLHLITSVTILNARWSELISARQKTLVRPKNAQLNPGQTIQVEVIFTVRSTYKRLIQNVKTPPLFMELNPTELAAMVAKLWLCEGAGLEKYENRLICLLSTDSLSTWT